MNGRLGFLTRFNWFGLWKNRLPEEDDSFKKWKDLNRLETVICLEGVVNFCYPTLSGFVHNHAFRHDCQKFEKLADHHQRALTRVFPLSQEREIAITDKLINYQMLLNPPNLFFNSVINLTINLNEYKIDIYRNLSIKDRVHRKLFEQFIEDSKDELGFLCRERNFHLSCWEDPLKASLN